MDYGLKGSCSSVDMRSLWFCGLFSDKNFLRYEDCSKKSLRAYNGAEEIWFELSQNTNTLAIQLKYLHDKDLISLTGQSKWKKTIVKNLKKYNHIMETFLDSSKK